MFITYQKKISTLVSISCQICKIAIFCIATGEENFVLISNHGGSNQGALGWDNGNRTTKLYTLDCLETRKLK